MTEGKRFRRGLLAALLLPLAAPAAADQARIRMTLVTPEGFGPTIGTFRAADTPQGIRLTPLMRSLPPGSHAIALRAKGDCGPGEEGGRRVAAGAAGPLFVPEKKDEDEAKGKDKSAAPRPPTGPGTIEVGTDGIARAAFILPGFTLAAAKGHAIVIENGTAAGRGERIACGLIP